MEENLSNGKNKNVKKVTNKKKAPAQPLSKRQELNNHIVCMRNGVRQARVQIINRLISQIQRYKNRKGNPKEQEKAKRKAERILDELKILKKIKKDIVSLYALQDTQKLDAVLNNPTSSTEERVLARLSHHNVITKDVQKYRDANPNWDKQIPVLLEMTREKRGKKKEQVNSAEKFALGLKPQETIVKTEKDSESDDDEQTEGLESRSESDVEVKEESIPKYKSYGSSENEEDDNDDDFSQAIFKSHSKRTKVERLPEVELKTTSSSKNSNALVTNKTEGTVKIKFLTDLNDLEEDNFEQHSEKEVADIPLTTQVKRPKSAFFVGGVDEPEQDPLPKAGNGRKIDSFQKTVPFNQNHHNGQFKPVYKKGKLVSKPPPPNRSQGNLGQNRKGGPPFRKGDRPDNRFGGNAEPVGAKKPRFSSDQQGGRLLQPHQKGEATTAEKLHPSWAAKKKQQQISLTEFKGKKIVFDD